MRIARLSIQRSILAVLLAAGTFAFSQNLMGGDQHDAMHHHGGQSRMSAEDARVLVELPPPLRQHMMANMRLHVSALNEIIEALATKHEDKAAHIAEWQLGLSSLKAHHADELGKHMPKEMRAIGWKMHSAASRFAIAAQNAGVTDDLRPALAALAEVTAQCTACHAGYRVH